MSEIAKTIIEMEIGDKISEMVGYLPSGLVLKTTTGMGATTSEIKSDRNSVIVEPLKYTATSKVFDWNENSDIKLFYFGRHDGKVNGHESLKHYLNDTAVKNKKIFCIPDNIGNLMEEIPLKEYFLLLDDIDTFQMDSVFRDCMDTCIDVYKKQPTENRAMITATPIGFTDIELQTQNITEFQCLPLYSQVIDAFECKNPVDYGMQIVLERYKDDRKLVVVLNHIESINNVIKWLEKNGVRSDDIAVLASKDRNDIEKKYKSNIENFRYPKKVNFITSAYYSGYDIYERYDLLVILDYTKKTTMITDSQFKQILGRFRVDHTFDMPKYIKAEIVYNAMEKYPVSRMEDELENDIEKAIDLIIIERGLDKLFRSTKNFNKYNLQNLDLGKVLAPGANSLLSLKEGRIELSMLKIDARKQEIRKLRWIHAGNEDPYMLYFDKWFFINKKKVEENIETNLIKNNADSELIYESLLSLLDRLNTNGYSEELRNDLNTFRGQGIGVIKTLIRVFDKYWNKIDPQRLVDILKEALFQGERITRDSRKLNRVEWCLDISCDEKYAELKDALESSFKDGLELPMSEMTNLFSDILNRNFIKTYDSSDKELTSILKTLIQFKRIRKDNTSTYRVVRFNSFR